MSNVPVSTVLLRTAPRVQPGQSVAAEPSTAKQKISDNHLLMNRRFCIPVDSVSGALTAVSDDNSKGVSCLCKCGLTCLVNRGQFVRGEKTSCGCRYGFLGRTPGNKTHGLRSSREYTSWNQMVQRCRNKNIRSYKQYGFKGITVVDEWVGPGGFERFFAHIGKRPTDAHSIDRFPKSDGNYEPGNVRWATKREQALNRRTTHWLQFCGRTVCVKDLAKELKISTALVRYRIRNGIALDAPKTPGRRQ